MRFRKDIGRRTDAQRRADGISIESSDLRLRDDRPIARCAFDRLRAEVTPSADCTKRVAAVLQELGYGFAMIPDGKSVPQRN